MAAQVLSFFQRTPRFAPAPADWSQQELAEFYRVEAALMRAGIRVGTDRGLSDENEPWFVFYRTDDGEVVIHFARIDGEYLIAGPAYEEIARGFDFSSLVRNMVARHPLIRRSDRGDNISIHPAALLVAVVGTAFFKTGEARAAETGSANAPAHARPALLTSSSSASLTGGAAAVATGAAQSTYDTVQLPASQAVMVLAAALLASDFSVDASTLDPAASAALASAAAALDFSGPTSMTIATESSDLALASDHVQALASTSAQTVSSVLSLVALLSTLPHASESLSTPEAIQDVSDVARQQVNLSPLGAPAVHEAANWSLEVRLGAGALPNVEAVQLVRALVGDTAAQKITVIEVAKLPDVLAEIISRGEHYQAAPITSQATETTAPETPVAASETSTSSSGETTTHQPESHATSINAGIVPLDLVTSFISFFTEHTQNILTYMNGVQVVMVDADLMHNPGALDHAMTMTFDFADGSELSLIGVHSAFLNGGLLH
ncbi:hypothetical protein [Caulobacter segnis]|uniref:hypothetical protein n=1 Tax=Caulobacter segnis TaxID=88688 RepID=UPI001CBB309D|nr:hypothetical protein [Caulobacter segnis]UAL11775.1 hypothetical protein K8940_05700 [Caulobacter segnis]